MRTKQAIPVFVCLMLAACSPPEAHIAATNPDKAIVIPSDPAGWDSIAPALDRLLPEEKRLVEAYLLRMGLENALAAMPSDHPQLIPAGTTIGAAIIQQQTFERAHKSN